MPGNYTVPTRADGDTLTAAMYNGDHQLHVDNNTPAGVDDYQADTTQRQLQLNPALGSAVSLGDEIAQLRYVINALGGGTTFWYEVTAPSVALQLVDKAVAAVGNKKDGVLVPYAAQLIGIEAVSEVAPVGADLIYDIKLNGTSVWAATPANRLTIPAGTTQNVALVFDTTILNPGDRLDLDILQVGTGPTGGNWSRLALLIHPRPL